ncbi:MAG: CHASE2 domain-containing protein, partial [Planctomycetota bacterium]
MAKTPRRLFHLNTPLRTGVGVVLGLVVGSLLLLLRASTVFESVELKFVDLRTEHFLGRQRPDPRIVLAEILDADVNRVLEAWTVAWPWELELNAYAFDVMREAGVQAVVVDVFHFDKGAGRDDVPESKHYTREAEAILAHQEEQGGILGKALAGLGRVALAFELHPAPEYEVAGRARAARTRLGAGFLHGAPGGLRRGGANFPVRLVLEGARLLGFANVEPDVDGVVRRAPTAGRWGKVPVPSLAMATAALAVDGDVAFVEGGVRVGKVVQPLMDDGSFLLNYRGDPGDPYPRVAPSQLLAWAAAKQETGVLPAAARKAL